MLSCPPFQRRLRVACAVCLFSDGAIHGGEAVGLRGVGTPTCLQRVTTVHTVIPQELKGRVVFSWPKITGVFRILEGGAKVLRGWVQIFQFSE